jgi:acylphosphatase
MIARRLRIEGRVQGVGYRDWATRTARGAGLSGWVRNRRDGSVEAFVCGDADVVERFIAECRVGPAAARVDTVDVSECPASGMDGFDVWPTA